MTEFERTWNPGDGPVLPPLPDEAYPPDAVPLPEPDASADDEPDEET